MSDYIERDKALAETWKEPRYTDVVNVLTEIRDRIRSLQSEDVQPVVHGKWIPVDSYSAFGGDEATWMAHGNPVAFYYCSHCKEQAYAGEDGESLITEYCPNCGAKMDGGEQDGR